MWIKSFKKVQWLLVIIILTACSGNKNSAPDAEQMVMSTLWYQHSAEMRALCYQSFNIAELRVRQMLEEYNGEKPPAVIVDIDETILDNSPSEAKNILEGERFSMPRWFDWTKLGSAEALPGSLEFAQFLQASGVELIYISNRMTEELNATIENLKKIGFQNADPDHIFLKSESSDKTSRREKVEESYEILLLVGDNLEDFSEVFGDRSDKFGKVLVDNYKDEFGRRFIMLPNPMYGSWTFAIYGSTSGLSPKNIAETRKKFLSDYQ